MSEFERVLQECLRDLDEGASSVEECLARHPKHAQQLEPVLLTSVYLARGREARVSDAFKARVRTRLIQQMYAHPHRQARLRFPFMRLAMGLAAMLLALLVAGTVYAQSALPGEAFYGWKLASENAWRAISPDPIGTNIAILERRVDELIAVRDDPALYTDVLKAYVDVVDRLRHEMNPETEALILEVLATQIEELNQSGISLQQPEAEPGILPPFNEPTPTSTATPLPVLETPQADSTTLPPVVPTIQVAEPTIETVPVIVPTVQEPPPILPTVEVPPLVP